MAIPHVFTTVKPQDFTLNEFVIHKDYELTRNTFYSGSTPQTGSGHKLLEALYFPEKIKLGTNSQNTYPTNSFDGSYKYIIWHSINAMYYKNAYDPYATLEHANPNFTIKKLHHKAAIISIPQHDFGETLKAGSIELTSSLYKFTDDKYGNLYLDSTSSALFTKEQALVGAWEFTDIFKHPKSYSRTDQIGHRFLTGNVLQNEYITYKSNTNNLDENKSFVKDIKVSTSNYVDTINPYVWLYNSYILTKHKDDFNFAKNEDFTIGFGLTIHNYPDYTGSILSKRGVEWKEQVGNFTKQNANQSNVTGYFYSSSFIDSPINVYPYDFEVVEQNVYFRRSDGVNTVILSSSLDYQSPMNINVTKSGSMYSIYKNGVCQQSESNDRIGHCFNNRALMFGAVNLAGENGYENDFIFSNIRLYNTAMNESELQYLYRYDNEENYEKKVVGNAFYRQGFIVISAPSDIYCNDVLNNDFTLKFKSTHTIYQYECLVRIKKGDYNLSLNPTTLQNPQSDLLRSEMTGSLADGALFPYITEIGLYNDTGELLVVGKLSQPVQMRDDVDLNVILRWDA